MNRIKRFFVTLTAAAVITSAMPLAAFANTANFPHAFWALDEKYQAAVNSKNYNDIIKYGRQELELMSSVSRDESVYNVLGSRAITVAEAYEYIGEYEESIDYHKQYIDVAARMNWDAKASVAKVSVYAPSLGLYTLTNDKVKYYGAKFEPTGGTYFGTNYEGAQPRDSMILIYQEYGQTSSLPWLNKALSEASSANRVVELALNFPNEANQLDSICADTSFINSFCDVLKKHTDLKIFLRIGAEMNIWSTRPNGESYKKAFRKVADNVRAAVSNAAIVWSPSYVSSWDCSMNDYYPGDNYVDWVGASAYCKKYFQGAQPSANFRNEAYFKAGDAAAPIKIMEEIVSKYGNRKPIMMSECGVSYYTDGSIRQNHIDWAVKNMKRLYSTVMMKYPQVKLMAYFNKQMPNEMQYYDFDSVPAMKSIYSEYTSQPWFIQRGESSAQSFRELDGTISSGDILDIYALPYVFKDEEPKVDFYVDDTWINSSSALPYRVSLNLSNISQGQHTLRCIISSNGKDKYTRTYTLNKTSSSTQDNGTATGGGNNASSNNNSGSFSDIAILTPAQKSAVEYSASHGIINGYDDNTFRPYSTITRAELATMVCRAFGYSTGEECGFDDARGHWASRYIQACFREGAINGIGNNKFAPDNNVTVGQATKIVTICAGLASEGSCSYPDGYIEIASRNGIYNNTGISVARQVDLSGLSDILSSLLPAVPFNAGIADVELTRIDAAVMFRNAL